MLLPSDGATFAAGHAQARKDADVDQFGHQLDQGLRHDHGRKHGDRARNSKGQRQHDEGVSGCGREGHGPTRSRLKPEGPCNAPADEGSDDGKN